MGLGALFCFLYGLIMTLSYSLAVPVCVVEGLRGNEALKRSRSLSDGAEGRIFILGLLTAVIQFGFIGITQFPFIVMAIKHPDQHLAIGLQALQHFLNFITTTLIGPIYATALTLFYYDQRVRKEGFDIEWMMMQAGLEAPLQPVDQQQSLAGESITTNTDFPRTEGEAQS